MLNPDTTDWSSVHCAAESYNPSVIPLPIRMGRPYHNRVGDVPPSSKGNVELLKVVMCLNKRRSLEVYIF